MSIETELLARQMVHLERAMQQAAREHRWSDAQELDDLREQVRESRSELMRREHARQLAA